MLPKDMRTNPLLSSHRPARSGALLGLLVLLGAGVISSCDSSEAAPLPGIVGGGMTLAQTRAIDSLKTVWDAAWTAQDAVAYAGTYATDADFVNPLGNVLPGREGVKAAHTFLFGGPFAGSSAVSVIRRGIFLADSVVLVDLNVTLTGYHGLLPGLHETQPGVVRTLVTWIVAKRSGRWEILAQQMTAVAPSAS